MQTNGQRPTTRLFLVRHGQTLHNHVNRLAGWTDTPLTALGRQQAEQVADHLAGLCQPQALYTSPLQRARETAQAIGRRLGLTPVVVPDLREMHFGACENLTLDEIRQRFPDLWPRLLDEDDLTFTWPGGESRAGFIQRVRQVFTTLLQHHPGETIVIVAHGGVLAVWLADQLEGRPTRWRAYQLDNCAVCEVEAGNGRLHLHRFNDCAHLGLTPPSAP